MFGLFYAVLIYLSRLLSDVVLNFQTSQEEISLIVKPEKTSFKNYIDSEGGELIGKLT